MRMVNSLQVVLYCRACALGNGSSMIWESKSSYMCIGKIDKTPVDTTQHIEASLKHDKHGGYIESEDHGKL